MSIKDLLLLSFLFNFSIGLIGQDNKMQQANILMEEENYEVAASMYKDLCQQYLAKEDYTNYLHASMQLSMSLDYMEQSNEAMTVFEKAIELAKNKNGIDSLLAVGYHKLALIYYYSFEDDETAIHNWQKALKIREAIYPSNHKDVIKSYRNIGQSFLNLKEWEKAKIHFQKSLDLNLNREDVDSLLLVKAYNYLGWVYTNLEDFNKAEKYFDLAKEKYNHFYEDDPWELYELYENLSEFYRKQEMYSKVIEKQKEILAIFLGIKDKWEGDYRTIAKIYNNLGLGYEQMDSLGKALNACKNSIKINKQYIQNNAQVLTENYNNLTHIYQKQSAYKEALNAIEKAIGYDLSMNDSLELAASLNNKAMVLLDKGDIDLALNTINQVLIISKFDKNKNLVWNKTKMVTILSDKLKILKSIGNKQPSYLKEVPQIIQQIIDLTNQIRTDYQSDESKAFLSKKSKPIFENAIETILQLYQQTKEKKYITQAFQLAEQSKSIILMDALQQAQARQSTNVPTELLDTENDLKRKIAQKEKVLFLNKSDANNINSDLIQLNQTLEKLTDTLKQNYPKYHEAKYATKLPSITEIQQKIDGNLLEYFVGDSTIYAFKITKNQANIDYVEIPIDFPLGNWIKQLRAAIYKPFLQKSRSDEAETKYAQTLTKIAFQLHQKLVAPIIKQQKEGEKLVIIPDGILGYIPFDVLLTNLPKVENASLFGTHDYLINDFKISYAYSAASLLEMKNKTFAKQATRNFTAFAPVFEGKKEVAFARNIDAIRGELTPLKFNIPEVTAIQQLVGGNIFTGRDASRSNFIDNATNSKIVHLATHGKANDETGDYAYLAFTDLKDASDFKLYNRDLYNLELNADMVVLSACETGIGELQKGEGIISLARGFTYAGAKSIVTTLWSINDNRTKEIMENFYGNLKEGETKDAALRQAKLDFIDNYSHNAHPFFWAAFIPIGEMEAIDFNDDWLFKFGIIGIIGLMFYLFWRIYKTKTMVQINESIDI